VATVTAAEPHHVDALAVLFEEMDRFYDDPSDASPAVKAKQIAEALFGEVPAGAALLAWDGDVLVGMAGYSFLWPAVGVTRSLYLKELYVSAAHRRNGVGKLLMDALFEIAKKHRCSRMEWTTDATNQDAQRFYKEIDVLVNTSKLFYRVELERAQSSPCASISRDEK
jgi:GNAT superfamily N-acetyltransferase